MADAHKNFAYSTVATAPSPASSGTSLVVASGHGTLFPTAPFNCTVWPAGSQPTAANAEIVRVTAVSTDTFTIVRTQESTSARSILVGDQIAATITAKTLTDVEVTDGWAAAGETWTYASADDPTFTFTIAGVDLTTKYSAGMRVKLTQTTAKFFIITKVAFSTDTTITIYGGTDYDLANAAITSPYWSMVKAPFGFPLSPLKWSVKATDTTQRVQAAPASGTWYNLGSVTISIPIGCWNVDYQVLAEFADSAGTGWTVFSTLSTANNTESDTELTSHFYTQVVDSAVSLSRSKVIELAAKTSYYLNTKTTIASLDNLYNRNEVAPLIIRAVCAYL